MSAECPRKEKAEPPQALHCAGRLPWGHCLDTRFATGAGGGGTSMVAK